MKKVISVTINEDGTIKGLLFEGNKKATPVKTVIQMIERGRDIDFADTDLEVVNRKSGAYIRKKANDTKEDNLGTMVEAVKEEEAIKEAVWEEVKANPSIMDRLRGFLFGKR